MRLLRILLFVLITTSFSCESDDSNVNCGTHNGKELNIGPRGGCFYINSNGNKTYVDRSECNC